MIYLNLLNEFLFSFRKQMSKHPIRIANNAAAQKDSYIAVKT